MYRRRRAVVGALVLFVLAAFVAGGFAVTNFLGRHSEAASSTETLPAPAQQTSGSTAAPTSVPSSAPATATASPTSAGGPACDQGKVTVSASTDAAIYPAGKTPIFSLKVTNSGSVPCEINLGTNQMEFLVTSGNDRVFSSKDCQDGGQDLVKVIPPGATETANFPWARTRSLPGCAKTLSSPGQGGSTYVLVTKLGNRTSQKAVFQLG